MPLAFDHLVVVTDDLAEGTAWVEDRLGLPLEVGGRHPHMGTWNRLLSLGPGAYLEVIAIDPGAAPPPVPRWYGLDDPVGAPRLGYWVARSTDLDASLAAAPPGLGQPMSLSRGDLTWRMALPEDGRLPFDGAAPALIEWTGGAHPSDALPDSGARLARLEVRHPEADALVTGFAELITVGQVGILTDARPSLAATLVTPRGRVRLD